MSTTPDVAGLVEAAKSAFTNPFGGVLALRTPDGRVTISVDGNADPVRVLTTKAPSPNCTLVADLDILQRSLRDERNFERAYLAGRIQIAGDMSLPGRLKFSKSA